MGADFYWKSFDHKIKTHKYSDLSRIQYSEKCYETSIKVVFSGCKGVLSED